MIVVDEATKIQETVMILDTLVDSSVSYWTDCELFDVHFGSGLVQMRHKLGSDNFGELINCSFYAKSTLTNQTSKFPVHIKVSSTVNSMPYNYRYRPFGGTMHQSALHSINMRGQLTKWH